MGCAVLVHVSVAVNHRDNQILSLLRLFNNDPIRKHISDAINVDLFAVTINGELHQFARCHVNPWRRLSERKIGHKCDAYDNYHYPDRLIGHLQTRSDIFAWRRFSIASNGSNFFSRSVRT